MAGRGQPHQGNSNLFFAFAPAALVADQIETIALGLKGQCGQIGRLVKKSRYHLTMQFIGRFHLVPSEVLAAATAAADLVVVPPMEIVLDRVGSFHGRLGQHPLVLSGSEGQNQRLVAFNRSLGKELRQAGLKVEDNFVPHVTLYYAENRLDFSMVPIVWSTEDLLLVQSGGGQHIVLQRWPASDTMDKT